MIGGIVMILVAVWIYQSASRAKVEKTLFWVVLCSVVFLAVQFTAVYFNVYLLETFKGGGFEGGYERDLASIGDRKTKDGIFQGFTGTLLSIVFELMPPLLGVLAVAFIRTKFMLKEALTVANLFSGMKELFVSIKNSFKPE
ncbi:hypothetical protein [Methylotuvimicrobium alcaliphilum]|jgi:uncharacterized protein YqgC (DUF456 family)|uniref:Uncharacterized protein n=1 Tax=Methylotuvimicrobium alcaliphilum (strain DSM 19304 / NCIMB 14124 / VKM B-2133 / 20Z) TaxID=1091494 RepID=G4SZ69_META2|nr:hypothetical protein [Methylotuvimicrobium alcaliphilum]CCE22219.1 conserved protein of unknown function [Methylotuvimicrobium alcaliphilum 20Z]